MANHDFNVIMFDLGGVLVELTGIPTMLEWTGGHWTVQELWRKWLLSPAGRLFEGGKISPDDFAVAMVKEFELPVTPEVYLEKFVSWVSAPYEGALELLAELSTSHKVACLSNTNILHWDRMRTDMGLGRYFDHAFPSHETGLVKPDAEAFLEAVKAMETEPSRVLYFDDAQLNVDSAAALGLAAYRVDGVVGVREVLAELGVGAWGGS